MARLYFPLTRTRRAEDRVIFYFDSEVEHHNHARVTEGHTPSPPSARLPSVGAQKQPDGNEGGVATGARRGS